MANKSKKSDIQTFKELLADKERRWFYITTMFAGLSNNDLISIGQLSLSELKDRLTTIRKVG